MINLIRIVIDYIKNDMIKLWSENKTAFFLAIIIAIIVAYSLASWRYHGIIDNLGSSIKSETSNFNKKYETK